MEKTIKNCISEVEADGIPNIVTEPNTPSKLFWSILSVAAISIFLYHNSTLFVQLKSEQVSVTLTPNIIPFIQPDILICLRKPIAIDYLHNPPIKDLAVMTRVVTDIGNIDNKFRQLNRSLQQLFNKDPSNFLWNSINITEFYQALFYRPNALFLKISCNGKILNNYLTLEMNWFYLGCWRITPDICLLSNPWAYIKLIMYIHSFNLNIFYNPISNVSLFGTPIEMFRLNQANDLDVTDSVIIHFVGRGENIVYNTAKVSLMGGKEADITISAVIFKHLNRTGFNCSDQLRKVTVYDLLQPGKTLSFNDSYTCMMTRSQRRYYRLFNCVVAHYPIPVTIPSNARTCLNISNNDTFLTTFVSLFQSSTVEAAAWSRCSQRLQCTTISYKPKFNYMNWPLPGIMTKFLQQVLPRKLIFDRQAGLSNPGLEELMQDLQTVSGLKLSLWNENFYYIMIRPGEYNSTQLEETIPYTFRNFFADAGGILGFYTGASLLTLCEIFRLMNHYLYMIYLAWTVKIRHVRL